MNLTQQKQALRNEARVRRAALKASAPDAGRRVAENFLAKIPLQKNSVIAGYIAARDELDPAELVAALRARGHALVLPRVVVKGGPLAFHRWDEDAKPVKGAYDLFEAGLTWPLVRPDVVMVPLLAFDAEGFRLGYGGGYYDCSLLALRETGSVVPVGLAYDGQRIARIPRDATDERLDWAVTEKGATSFVA